MRTLSSDGQETDGHSAAIATYAFAQLDAPANGGADIADVLSAAWAEAEQIRARARAGGEAEGRSAGLAAAGADVEAALAALTQALQGVDQAREQLIAELHRDAAELALSLAEQILAGVLSVEPERVVDVARNALRHLSDRRHVTLVVNPDDLEVMGAAVASVQAQLGGIEHLAVQADRRIGRGGAIARTEEGEIDASLTAQLSRAREIVVAALSGESSREPAEGPDGD
jgi:flagellar assembly protein FliH